MKYRKPEFDYSLANITATARDADTFGTDGISDLLMNERMQIIVPNPTQEDCENYGLTADEDWDDGSQGACEYRDSFVPMMNSLWPVDLAYNRDEQTAAALMNANAGATSLVSIDDEHYIAMTGGGMNLSWHLAAAYVCCGCVPPLEILDSLKGSPFRLSHSISQEILKAWRHGAAWLANKAKRCREDMRATAKQVK